MLHTLLEVFLTLGYSFFFLYLIGRLKFFIIKGINQAWIRAAFLIKILAGITLGLIYTYYYTDRSTADVFKYFDDSAIMFNALWTAPADFIQMLTGFYGNGDHLWHYFDEMNNWFNSRYMFSDSRTMIRLNAFFRFFSMGSYFVHTVFICFLSFTGLIALLKVAVKFYPNKPITLLVFIFLFPSLVFWGSGVLKESLLLFALGSLLFSVDRFFSKPDWRFAVLSIVFVLLLINIKPYILAMLLPSIVAYALVTTSSVHAVLKFGLIHAIYFIAIILFTNNFTGSSFPELLTAKQQEFERVALVQEAKSVIDLPDLDNSYSSIISNAPVGFLTTITRPHLVETKNPMILLSAVENAIVLVLLLLVLIKILRSGTDRKMTSLLLFSIFFILILFTLIGLVTPILGAIVRYKVPALPFLGILFAHFLDIDKLIAADKKPAS